MAERYEEFDRGRNRERNWERDRNWDRERTPGERYDDYRREYRGEQYGTTREYDERDRDREYGRGRESWRSPESYGSESRYGGRYGTETSEFVPGPREEGRWRGGPGSQSLGGGMGTYSGQDWRSQHQASPGGGMGEAIGRDRESWARERRAGEYGEYQGGTWGPYGTYTYGTESYRGGLAGQGWYSGAGTTGRFTGRGPKGYQRSDERIREDVCERLTQHPDVDASDVEVQVSGGEVTLRGTVEDRHQKRVAEDAVENVFGVREVHNQLRVSKGIGQRIGEALGIGGREHEQTTPAGRTNEPTTPRR